MPVNERINSVERDHVSSPNPVAKPDYSESKIVLAMVRLPSPTVSKEPLLRAEWELGRSPGSREVVPEQ